MSAFWLYAPPSCSGARIFGVPTKDCATALLRFSAAMKEPTAPLLLLWKLALPVTLPVVLRPASRTCYKQQVQQRRLCLNCLKMMPENCN
jgi:hypothetical protein